MGQEPMEEFRWSSSSVLGHKYRGCRGIKIPQPDREISGIPTTLGSFPLGVPASPLPLSGGSRRVTGTASRWWTGAGNGIPEGRRCCLHS